MLICAEGRQQRIFTHRCIPPCADKRGGGFVTPEIITIITYANLWSTDDHVLGRVEVVKEDVVTSLPVIAGRADVRRPERGELKLELVR